MALPKTYDSPWYKGATFNPRARGTPEPVSHVPTKGNVSDDDAPEGLSPGVLAMLGELARSRRALNEAAQAERLKLDSVRKLQSAEDFLRSKGVRLDRRGNVK